MVRRSVRSIRYTDAIVRGLHRRLSCVELRYVDGIVRSRAISDMGDGLAAIIEPIFCQADCIGVIAIFRGDGHAIIVDGGIAHLDRALVAQVDVLVQAQIIVRCAICCLRQSQVAALNSSLIFRHTLFADGDGTMVAIASAAGISNSLFQLCNVNSICISGAGGYPSDLASNPLCTITTTDITYRYSPIRRYPDSTCFFILKLV